MSRFIAFGGNADVQSALLARLAEHAKAGTIDARNEQRWSGKSGTPTGCIAASNDLRAFEAQTGYPACLALLLDHLCASIAVPTGVEAFAADWLAKVTPGSDLSCVPSHLVIFVLADTLDDRGISNAPDITTVLKETLGLHHQAIAGTVLPRAAWSAVQVAAISSTDRAFDRLSKACGALAEAAAWDPLLSRSTLVEVAQKWSNMRAVRASLAAGWTEQDSAAFDACTKTFEKEILAHNPSMHTTEFPMFFQEHEPELSARFLTQLEKSNAAFAGALGEFARESLSRLATVHSSGAGV